MASAAPYRTPPPAQPAPRLRTSGGGASSSYAPRPSTGTSRGARSRLSDVSAASLYSAAPSLHLEEGPGVCPAAYRPTRGAREQDSAALQCRNVRTSHHHHNLNPSLAVHTIPQPSLLLVQQQCGAAFGMFRRKHHCRGCGRIFCSDCLHQTGVHLPHFNEFSTKACSNCLTPVVTAVNDNIPVATAGATVQV